MRVAVHSASAAVTRALEAALIASGHSIAPLEQAELILRDAVHAKPLDATTTRILTLTRERANPTTDIVCPLRLAQLQHLLTATPAAPPIALGGDWKVDPLARSLTHPTSAPVALTEKECTLLKTLAHAYPQALPRDTLLTSVWGLSNAIDTHTLETHIYRLRSKLAALSPSAGDLLTEAGAYRLTKP